MPARVEKLRVALALLDEPAPGRRERGVRVADERREVLRADAQLAVERGAEVRVEARVDEPAGRGEYDRHRDGECRSYAQPDRDARHGAPPSLSR